MSYKILVDVQLFLPRLQSLLLRRAVRSYPEMGTVFSSLRSRCISLWSRWSRWRPRLRPAASFPSDHERLPDVEEGAGESKVPYPISPPPKKRALLVGITYRDSASPTWAPLDGPHIDVSHFEKLLIRAYFIYRSVAFFYGH